MNAEDMYLADQFSIPDYWRKAVPESGKPMLAVWSPPEWDDYSPLLRMLWSQAQGYYCARRRWVETCLWEDGEHSALLYLQLHFRVWGVILEYDGLRTFLQPNGCINWGLVRALTAGRESLIFQEETDGTHA